MKKQIAGIFCFLAGVLSVNLFAAPDAAAYTNGQIWDCIGWPERVDGAWPGRPQNPTGNLFNPHTEECVSECIPNGHGWQCPIGVSPDGDNLVLDDRYTKFDAYECADGYVWDEESSTCKKFAPFVPNAGISSATSREECENAGGYVEPIPTKPGYSICVAPEFKACKDAGNMIVWSGVKQNDPLCFDEECSYIHSRGDRGFYFDTEDGMPCSPTRVECLPENLIFGYCDDHNSTPPEPCPDGMEREIAGTECVRIPDYENNSLTRTPEDVQSGPEAVQNAAALLGIAQASYAPSQQIAPAAEENRLPEYAAPAALIGALAFSSLYPDYELGSSFNYSGENGSLDWEAGMRGDFHYGSFSSYVSAVQSDSGFEIESGTTYQSDSFLASYTTVEAKDYMNYAVQLSAPWKYSGWNISPNLSSQFHYDRDENHSSSESGAGLDLEYRF